MSSTFAGLSGIYRPNDNAPRQSTFWIGLLSSALCGLLFALSMPPWGFWPLAFLGVAGTDFLLDNQSARVRLARASFVGVGWLFPSMIWMWDFSPMGYIAAGVGFSLFYGVAGVLCPPDRKLRWLALPALLVLVGYLRWRWPFGGVPLSTLAMSQSGSPLLETSRIFGSLFIVWLVGLGGVSIAAIIRRDWWIAAVGPVVLALAAGLAPLAPSARATDTIRVALVQGGGPQRTRAENTDFSVVLGAHLDATCQLVQPPADRADWSENECRKWLSSSQAATPPVDLVVWPENVVDVEGAFGPTTPQAKQIAAVAEAVGAPIVAGVIEDADEDSFNNFSIVITENSEFGNRYDKVHRVPFGEYVPLRWLVEPFAPDFLPDREAVAGTGPAILEIAGAANGEDLTAGIVISWEIFFEHRVRDAVSNGGQIILNPTNGSSYWLTIVQSQQVASSRLRAIETDRYVLQAAPTGFTAVVAPNGNVLERTSVSEQRVIHTDVELREGKTLPVRLGPWPPLGIALITFAYPGIRHLRNRRPNNRYPLGLQLPRRR